MIMRNIEHVTLWRHDDGLKMPDSVNKILYLFDYYMMFILVPINIFNNIFSTIDII